MTAVSRYGQCGLHTCGMYVPKPIYEYAPIYWVVLGILLIAVGIYLGMAGDEFYFRAGIGSGAIALAWGLGVLVRRYSRKDRQPCSTYDEYLDQTMELNLRDGSIPTRPTPEESPTPER